MRYAVSVCMTKQIDNGLNVQTYLDVVPAVSEDEARGVAVRKAMVGNTEHLISHIAIVLVADPPPAGTSAETTP